MTRPIPLTKPYWGPEEIQAVTQSLKTTLGTGDGPSSYKLVERLKKLLDVPFVIPVTSCTHGLELILSCLDLKKGDEVIGVAAGFPTTVNPILQFGALNSFFDRRSIGALVHIH